MKHDLSKQNIASKKCGISWLISNRIFLKFFVKIKTLHWLQNIFTDPRNQSKNPTWKWYHFRLILTWGGFWVTGFGGATFGGSGFFGTCGFGVSWITGLGATGSTGLTGRTSGSFCTGNWGGRGGSTGTCGRLAGGSGWLTGLFTGWFKFGWLGATGLGLIGYWRALGSAATGIRWLGKTDPWFTKGPW